MILCKCLVLAVVAVAMTAANSINYAAKPADMEMLNRQKKVFDLLMYVNNNVLPDAEYFEIGRNYDIMSNIDRYTNRDVVLNFLTRWRLGMLQKDALFTYYEQQQREEVMILYRLFYFAKDFTTFYKTACWARLHMNPGMFITAFTTAVIYRDDTRFIRLPAVYELYPNLFFDSKLIRDAQRIIMTRGVNNLGRHPAMGRNDMDSIETYHLYSNFTDMSISPISESENRLSYFMNDAGLNSYYYYFRMMFPFWMNTKEYNVPKDFRGDIYYFVHHQLMARYNLERISNGLGPLEDFTWSRMNLPGYNINMMYSNGVAMPRRDWWNMVPMYKLKYLEYLKKLEIRIAEAIDSGFVLDDMGKQVSLKTPTGLNILGNIIEGNLDSINLKYYGSYDVLSRLILGNNQETMSKNSYIPSSLQLWEMSMRDPAFYRIYNRIVHYFLRFKSLLTRYTRNELEFSGVKIENVDVGKLVTYWDAKDFLINSAVDVPTLRDGRSFNIKAWQYQLNYKPFTYKFAINSDKSTKGIMRIFLGPAVEGETTNDYSYLLNYYQYFFMLDEFEVNVKEGMNEIERLSSDSILFKKDLMSGDKFYKRIMQSIEGKEPLMLNERMWGFPEHLMLPKGSVDGMRFKLFFYIGPYEQGKLIDLPIFGKRMVYGKSCGFPLDRPMQPWFLNLGNIYLKDVLIYNVIDREMMSGHSNNMMMSYDRMMRMNDDEIISMKSMKDIDESMTMVDTDNVQITRGSDEHKYGNINIRNADRIGMMGDLNMMHV